MGDQSKAELKRLEARRNAQIRRIRATRSAGQKSESKSEDPMDSDSQKSNSKENWRTRKISVEDKRTITPKRKSSLENSAVDIEPFTDFNYPKKSSKDFFTSSQIRSNLKKPGNIQALDVEAGEEESQKPVPMNVVVDVHCENEVKSRSSRRNSQEPFSPNPKSKNQGSDESSKKNQKPRRFLIKPSQKFEIENQDSDIIKEVDFIQAIQEIQEAPSSSKLQEFVIRSKESKTDLSQGLKLSKKTFSGNEDENNSVEPSIQGTRRRKRWEKLETVYVTDDLRKVGKSWSQEMNSSTIGKEKTKKSWETSSVREDSPKSPSGKMMSQDKFVKPVPAPRLRSRKFLTESDMAFDNEAFLSDHEEVLKIETNSEDAKIKMSLETVDVKAVSDEKSKPKGIHNKKTENSSSAKSETSDIDSDNRRIQKKNKIPSFENSEEESVLLKKQSFVVKKLTRSKSIRRSGSDDTSNLENESSVSHPQNSDEISGENETSQKPSQNKIQVIHSKFSGQETTISSNEESDFCIDQVNQKSLKNMPKVKKSRSNSRECSEMEEEEKRKIEKRRKSDHRRSRTSSSTRVQESVGEDTGKKKKRKKKKKKEDKEENEQIKFISIIIHKSDVLEVDYITRHPMVKVHIVNAHTGNYLRNQENGEKNGRSYLQPVITGKFDFKQHRSMLPVWEEELIFEHDFNDILKTGDEQVIILFEVLDLLTFSEASLHYDHYGNEDCWYKIAWAFLRPVGTVGLLHINKKVRLQLYRPRRNLKKIVKTKCQVYNWWKSNKREKYPSSLFVTISAVDPPKLEPVYYEQLTLNELTDVQSDNQKPPERTLDEISFPKWSRLTAQSCKVPNKLLFETEIFENGSFYLAFSNDGKLLACTTSEEYEFPIIVYKVDEKKIHVQFSGHNNFVYSLNWSQDDQYLLSVSSDQTARVWDVNEKIVQHIQLLPHPSYVYCGKFDPANLSTVVTGCYDHVTRIWVKMKNSKTYELVQELEVHEGFINSICFQKDGSLLTADSVGVIILWIIKKNRRGPIRNEWQMAKKIKIKEIEGIPINTIVLHPRGSRLLVHSRNNGLRLLDLATGVVLQRYEGLENRRIQTAACISPCAGLVFCGGEDSTLNVWNLETGRHLAKYTTCDNQNIVSCIDYHPYDHVLAYSTFGSPASLKLLIFDKDSSGENVGLQLLVNVRPAVFTNNEIVLHPLETSRTKTLWSSSSKRRSSEESFGNIRTFHSKGLGQLSNFGGSTGLLIENEDDNRKENLKMKLQRFMESGPSLKTRSMNRLNNIIEKIDKILLNASSSKSPVDLEAAMNVQDQDMILVANNPKLEHGERKSKPVVYKNYNENAVNSPSEEGLEMKIFTIEKKSSKERPKSAKASRSSRQMDEELLKTFSDSAVVCQGNELVRTKHFNELNYIGFKNSNLNREYEDHRQNQKSSSSGSVVIHQYGFLNEKRPGSPDSDGTYVVEKSDLEKNVDFKSGENFGNESSIQSNVTFTVVSEVPVPVPRKKKSLIP